MMRAPARLLAWRWPLIGIALFVLLALGCVACGGTTTANPPTPGRGSTADRHPAEASSSPGAAAATVVAPSPSPALAASAAPSPSPVTQGSPPYLTFELTGGFRGLTRRLTITSAGQATLQDFGAQSETRRELTPQEMAQLASSLGNSAFFSQAESQSRPCADCFNYRITVQQDGRSHSVEANDLGADSRLAGLVEWLVGFLERGLDQ